MHLLLCTGNSQARRRVKSISIRICPIFWGRSCQEKGAFPHGWSWILLPIAFKPILISLRSPMKWSGSFDPSSWNIFFTKGSIPQRFIQLFKQSPEKILAQIGLGPPSLRNYWRGYEPGTPSPEERLWIFKNSEPSGSFQRWGSTLSFPSWQTRNLKWSRFLEDWRNWISKGYSQLSPPPPSIHHSWWGSFHLFIKDSSNPVLELRLESDRLLITVQTSSFTHPGNGVSENKRNRPRVGITASFASAKIQTWKETSVGLGE